ncbi:MAG: 2-oxoacid:acceptor oxidoreductase family protein [Methanocellales archaeon]
MQEIIWYGRGGQGVVTSAEVIALAAMKEGKYAQAFPSFGPERRGAPVMAFNRISETPIESREQIHSPDILIILDPTLLRTLQIKVKKDGLVIINSKKSLAELKSKFNEAKIAVINATKIALETFGIPLINAPMIGAFIKATNLVNINSALEIIKNKFPSTAEKDEKAIKIAYNQVEIEK